MLVKKIYINNDKEIRNEVERIVCTITKDSNTYVGNTSEAYFFSNRGTLDMFLCKVCSLLEQEFHYKYKFDQRSIIGSFLLYKASDFQFSNALIAFHLEYGDEIIFRIEQLNKHSSAARAFIVNKENINDNEEEECIIEEKNNVNRGNKTMKINLPKIFENFGPIKNNDVALGINGKIAVKKVDSDGNEKYLQYNEENNTLEDQMGMIIDTEGLIMLIPSQNVEKGDIIKSNGNYYYVLCNGERNTIFAISFNDGSEVNILKENNMFNANYVAKVVSILSGTNGFDNPMMLALMNNDNMKDLAPILMLQNSQKDCNNNMNSLLPLLLMNKDGGDTNIQSLMMLRALQSENKTCNSAPVQSSNIDIQEFAKLVAGIINENTTESQQ